LPLIHFPRTPILFIPSKRGEISENKYIVIKVQSLEVSSSLGEVRISTREEPSSWEFFGVVESRWVTRGFTGFHWIRWIIAGLTSEFRKSQVRGRNSNFYARGAKFVGIHWSHWISSGNARIRWISLDSLDYRWIYVGFPETSSSWAKFEFLRERSQGRGNLL
jgi:hypothetical protein